MSFSNARKSRSQRRRAEPLPRPPQSFFRLCNRRLDYLSIVASMGVVAHGDSAERRKVVLRGTLHSGTFVRVLQFLLKRKGPPCGFHVQVMQVRAHDTRSVGLARIVV